MNAFVRCAALLALGVVVTAGALAQSGSMKDMPMGKSQDMPGMKAMPDTGKQGALHDGVGVVKSVDAKNGTVTLQHEPIPTIGWSAMTMSFAAADKKMLDQVKPGDKVHFQLKESASKKGTYVVTSIKP